MLHSWSHGQSQMGTEKQMYRQGHSDNMLRVSALHYSTRSWNLEGVQTVASAHVLHQPTIVHLSISIISIQSLEVNLELSIALIEMSVEFIIKLEYFPIIWKSEFGSSE